MNRTNKLKRMNALNVFFLSRPRFPQQQQSNSENQQRTQQVGKHSQTKKEKADKHSET